MVVKDTAEEDTVANDEATILIILDKGIVEETTMEVTIILQRMVKGPTTTVQVAKSLSSCRRLQPTFIISMALLEVTAAIPITANDN